MIFAQTQYDHPKGIDPPAIVSPCLARRKEYVGKDKIYRKFDDERLPGVSYLYDQAEPYDFDFVQKWFYIYELSPKYNLEFPDYDVLGDESYALPSGNFWASPYDVTQSEFYRFMGFNPSFFASCGGKCPVENLTWYQAIAYANARSKSENIETCYVMNQCDRRYTSCKDVSFKGLDCRGYRLMTDEEWRYLEKQNNVYSAMIGNRDNTDGSDYALTMKNGQVSYYGCLREGYSSLKGYILRPEGFKADCFGPHEVGTRRPTSSGLYDFYGNVHTWVWDWYGFAGKSGDSLAPDYGFCRIVRGTNFFMKDGRYDSNARHCYPPDKGAGLIGLRLVRTQDGYIGYE